MNSARLFPVPPSRRWTGYVFALAACAVATLSGLPFRAMIDAENVVVLYLVAIVVTAARQGGGPAMAASLLAVATYNFFFTRPYYSLNVYDYHDLITLLLLLVSSLLIGAQTSRLRMQTHSYRRKEQETTLLYAMANHLAGATTAEDCLAILRQHIVDAFDASAVLWHPAGELMEASEPSDSEPALREQEAARWAHQQKEAAGMGTSTLAGADYRYLPIPGSEAVLAIKPRGEAGGFNAKELAMIASFVALARAALERAAQTSLAESRRIEAEGEAMRATILAAVSHDFRTPLASVRGAIDGLLLGSEHDPAARHQLLDAAHGEIVRLERMVGHLLDLTQLTTGRLQLTRDFYFLPELVGVALKQTAGVLEGHVLKVALDEAVPPLEVDGLLIEQVLVNLLENAARHTPQGTTVTLEASVVAGTLQLDVGDDGPGIALDTRAQLFQSFHASRPRGAGAGSGLGLAICDAVMRAHGGSIVALPRIRGACFRLSLPLGPAPTLPEEAA